MAYILAALGVTNLISLGLFIRARSLNRQLTTNTVKLKQWLRVQHDLEVAGVSLIEVRRMDSQSIFYRDPPK